MIFQVDKEQYLGAEVVALLNAEIESMKAGADRETLNEMSDIDVVDHLVYIAYQRTNNVCMHDIISRYCRKQYAKEIVSFIRN